MSSKLKRRLRRTALTLLALYLLALVIAFAAHIPDELIIATATGPEDSHGADRLLLSFQNGDLEIFTAQSPAAKKSAPQVFMLIFVGNEDRADKYPAPMAETYSDKPIEIWAVNYPGFGGSTGPAHLNRFGPAALAAYDALAKKAAGKPILVRGTSLGTLGALCVAAHRPITSLWLRNPLPLPQLIRGEWGWWNLWLFAGPVSLSIPSDINAIANARLASAPCTFVLSDSDEVIPPPYQHQIVDAYAGPKHLVNLLHSKHNTPIDPPTRDLLSAEEDAFWKSLPSR